MLKRVSIEEFLNIKKDNKNIKIVDVRSNDEYLCGHIDDALNIELLDNEERKIVGTEYKQVGNSSAVIVGLEIVSKKLVYLFKSIISLVDENNSILIYCARGGMRSQFVSNIISMYGVNVYTLDKGYKSYRRHVLDSFEKKYKIIILSGKTGSAKTFLLKEIKNLKQQVIDLEGLANHKGSAFGAIGEDEQPTQEQFENNLFRELDMLDIDKHIWLEDESFLIGRRAIPKSLFNQMSNCDACVVVDVDASIRATHISNIYGVYDKNLLAEAIIKIKKRLGSERMKEALDYLENDDIYNCVITLLYYYDKSYRMNVCENIVNIKLIDMDFEANALSIVKEVDKSNLR